MFKSGSILGEQVLYRALGQQIIMIADKTPDAFFTLES
jgi:hypothetical protein